MLMLKHSCKIFPVGAWSHYPEISIDGLAAASKSTGREVLSHLGCRFHRIYVKLNSTAVVEGDIYHRSADIVARKRREWHGTS